MSTKHIVVVLAFGLAGQGQALGDQPLVTQVSKQAAKGGVEAVKESVGSADLKAGAKQITKGVLDSTERAVPAIEAGVIREANTDKVAIGGVARQVSQDAAAGVATAFAAQLEAMLGEHGDGPVATTLAATTERLAASAVRGASSEVHLGIGMWMVVLAFVLGGVTTVLGAIACACLYLFVKRRRENGHEHAAESVPTSVS